MSHYSFQSYQSPYLMSHRQHILPLQFNIPHHLHDPSYIPQFSISPAFPMPNASTTDLFGTSNENDHLLCYSNTYDHSVPSHIHPVPLMLPLNNIFTPDSMIPSINSHPYPISMLSTGFPVPNPSLHFSSSIYAQQQIQYSHQRPTDHRKQYQASHSKQGPRHMSTTNHNHYQLFNIHSQNKKDNHHVNTNNKNSTNSNDDLALTNNLAHQQQHQQQQHQQQQQHHHHHHQQQHHHHQQQQQQQSNYLLSKQSSIRAPKIEVFEPISKVYRSAVVVDLSTNSSPLPDCDKPLLSSQSSSLNLSSSSVLVRYVDDRVPTNYQYPKFQNSDSAPQQNQSIEDVPDAQKSPSQQGQVFNILEEFVPAWRVKGLKEHFVIPSYIQTTFSPVQINDISLTKTTTTHTFTVNDSVHVRAGCANTGAWLWWEAIVTKVHPDPSTNIQFYSVRFPSVQIYDEAGVPIQSNHDFQDDEEIVEALRVRPADCHFNIHLVKEKWDISEDISKSILENVPISFALDCSEKRELRSVADAIGLCSLSMSIKNDLVLEAIGIKGTLENAKLALEILYFRNAKEMARLQELQKMLETKLQLVKQKKECGFRLVFYVENDIIGSCIGRGGANLKRVHRLPGVIAININDVGTSHEIEIFAESEPFAKQAKENFEHVRARMYITREEIGPIIGRRGVHLREIERKSGVSKFFLKENNVDELGNTSPPYFETVGTRTGIEIATKLLNLHRTALAQQRKLEANVKKARAELLQVSSICTLSPQEMHSLSTTPSSSSPVSTIPPSPGDTNTDKLSANPNIKKIGSNTVVIGPEKLSAESLTLSLESLKVNSNLTSLEKQDIHDITNKNRSILGTGTTMNDFKKRASSPKFITKKGKSGKNKNKNVSVADSGAAFLPIALQQTNRS